jgi:hypothetical protein
LVYGNTNSSNNVPKPNNSSYSQPLNHFQRRQANRHDMSAYDLLQAFMHQTGVMKTMSMVLLTNVLQRAMKLRITTLCLLMQLRLP